MFLYGDLVKDTPCCKDLPPWIGGGGGGTGTGTGSSSAEEKDSDLEALLEKGKEDAKQ